MHMADALISPIVGGAMGLAAAGLIGYSAKKLRNGMDEAKVPLMGVAAAFVFAAQMMNFTIPATGSSGHIGGGLLLAALLGPHAALLAIASVLVVQALLFADGGLLALGCNIVNLGFFPAFVAYPLIFRRIAGAQPSRIRLSVASVAAAVVGLQLGAFGVVLQTVASGISSLPFSTFVWLMQPIHLAIGIVEGFATAAVLLFVQQARPEILEAAAEERPLGALPLRRALAGLAGAAVILGGALSWFASTHPDGLEWAIFRTSGAEELEAPDGVHQTLAAVQQKTALLPDYGFPAGEDAEAEAEGEEAWPAVSAGTSVAGLTGGLVTLALAALFAFVLRRALGGRSA